MRSAAPSRRQVRIIDKEWSRLQSLALSLIRQDRTRRDNRSIWKDIWIILQTLRVPTHQNAF